MAIEFDVRLQEAGWLEATISDDHNSVLLTASYLSDALGDLLKAVSALLNGATSRRCSWTEEPGEFRWLFERSADDVRLRILRLRDAEQHLPDEAGHTIFDTTQQLLELARGIAAGAEAVLDEFGTDGYLRRWQEHPFPLEQLAAVEEHLPD